MDTFNTLRPRQNGRYFPDDIFKCIFFNENVWITIQISLKFVPKGPINNIPALVWIMAWHRPGDKPLSEPMMARLLTHICALGLDELNPSEWHSIKREETREVNLAENLSICTNKCQKQVTSFGTVKSTAWCYHNTVKFLPNPHNLHLIACPWGCLLWVQILIYILLRALQTK